MSSRAGSTLPSGFSVEGHLGEYTVFGLLLSVALAEKPSRWSTVGLAVLIASLYGITDEFHQYFVPLRTPDVADWALDTLGAAIGATTAHLLAKGATRRRQRTPSR